MVRRTVIIVNDQARITGGAPKVALNSAVALAHRGHKVIVYSAVGPVAPELQNVENLSVECLNHFEILDDPSRLRAMTSGIWNREARARLVELVKKYAADKPIVHFHGWMKSLSPSVLDGALSTGTPCVVSLHDYFTACPTGGFFDHGRGEICLRKPLSTSCVTAQCDPRSYQHKMWRMARTVVQKRIAGYPRRCKHFVMLSPLSRKILLPHLPVNAQTYMLDNPIAAVDGNRVQAEDNDVYLFVGRLSREKGIMYLAEAAARTGIKVVVVGDGPLRADAEALMPNAIFTGWLSPAGVMEWMRKARAIMFPSTWYEVQPLVPIEAAAMGIPTIMSDCVAATDYLPDGERAMHFKQSDVPALVAAIQKASDASVIKRLSENCYQWYWEDPWTLDRHVRNLEAIYDQVAGAA